MRDAEFCPRCSSENVEEDPEDSDYIVCQDCSYRWTRNNDGEALTEEEMDEETLEEDSNEDSEGDGLMMGDSMFPPEDFDKE